jgi:flagellar hook-associated protein 2
MGFAIDGLVSGLDTTAMIENLMKVEANPQALLVQKKSTAERVLSALQGMNAKVASLAEAATKASKDTSWNLRSATSSSESVTSTATGGTSVGTVTFSVDAVATSQISLSARFTDVASLMQGGTKLTVRSADGTLTEITPAGTDIGSLTKAINDSASGVKATAVRVASGEPPEYRLQLTGTETGTDHTFELLVGTKAEVEGGGGTRIDDTLARQASNARITLWKGSGAPTEVAFEQSSNTFAGLMDGVDVTITKVEADPVTISVGQDDAALTKLGSSLVSQLNQVLAEIKSRTATTTTTDSSGKTVVNGGLLTGDSATRALQQALISAGSRPVDGLSPSTAGIELGRDGTFTFNEKAFTEALASDPTAAQRMVMGVAAAVGEVATAASDKYDGSLTKKITNHESNIKSMGEQISDWDRRLVLRRAGLQRTWSALEVTLSGLNAQQSWLTSQLSSLSGSSGK